MSATITIDGITYVATEPAAPAESAPAAPVAASPFAMAGVRTDKRGKVITDTRPDVIREAAAAAPDGERDTWAREAARVHFVPGYACDQITNVGGVDVAAHGYAHIAKGSPSGSKCKSPACPGKIL